MDNSEVKGLVDYNIDNAWNIEKTSRNMNQNLVNTKEEDKI
jgi:hypothetical protein